MTLEEEILKQEEEAMTYKSIGNQLSMNMSTEKQIRAMDNYYLSDYHKQIAEWLKVLKEIWDSGDCNDCRNGQCEWNPASENFFKWLALEIMQSDEDFKDNSEAFQEMCCRKLIKLGIIKKETEEGRIVYSLEDFTNEE